MNPKATNYQHLASTMIEKFARRNIDALYCATREEACAQVLQMMPQGSSVTYGGSMTLVECGILDAVKAGDYDFIERMDATTEDERRAMFARQAAADYMLMSTNAFTADGELVNIDGNGNRVALLVHGPAHVIIVTGMNKFTRTLDEALSRVRNVASPANCVRLGCETPCAKTGMCGDCHGASSICCQEVVTRMSRHTGRICVVMVGEDLGY